MTRESARRAWMLPALVAALALAGSAGYRWYPRLALPPAEGAALLALSVAAGIASFFSPCAFPLLLALLAHEGSGSRQGRRRRILGYAAALAAGAGVLLALTAVTIAAGGAALLGGVTFMSTTGRALRLIAGTVLIALGLAQIGYIPNPTRVVARAAMPLRRAHARVRRAAPAAGYGIFGFAYLLAGFG